MAGAQVRGPWPRTGETGEIDETEEIQMASPPADVRQQHATYPTPSAVFHSLVALSRRLIPLAVTIASPGLA